jgi:hypothetical protein
LGVRSADQPTAHHGQYFLKQTIRNYDEAKLLRRKTQVTQITPIRPPTQQGGNSASGSVSQLKLPRAAAKNKETTRQAGAGVGRVVATPYAPKARKGRPPPHTGDPRITERCDNSRCPQPPPGDDDNEETVYERINPAGDRTTLLTSVGLKHERVNGDGNCLPYSVLQSIGRPVNWEAAIKLREEAIAHARKLPHETQIELRLCRPDTHPHDPMGNDLNHRGVGNVWPIAAHAKYGTAHGFRLGVCKFLV